MLYILHGTPSQNVFAILQKGCISKDRSHTRNMTDTDQVFTQLVYEDIPYEQKQLPHWYDACFVLSSELLKDKPFYATETGGFHQSFSEGMHARNTIAKGYGKLSRLPRLKSLRELIDTAFVRKPYLKSATFIHSHEVMFGSDISIKKYCVALVLPPSFHPSDQVLSLSHKQGVKVLTNNKPGLNQFLGKVNTS